MADELNQIDDKSNQELDFLTIFKILWREKIKITIFTFVTGIFSIFYSLSLPNIYQSEAVLSLSNSSGSALSKLAQNYSGIASLAGINLPDLGNEGDGINEGIETIKSLNFFEEFIIKDDLFIKLLAVRSWDQKTNTITLNSNIYDAEKNIWLDDSIFALNGKPSIQTAHRNFLDRLTVSINNKTGFLELKFVHLSPHIAKEFLDLLIGELNEKKRSKDKSLAEKTINFLEIESKKTQLKEVRIGINNLIQRQIEKITFANASPEYLFKVLSKPSAPELKLEPRRSVICIVITFIGAFLICLYFIAKDYYRKSINLL
tara:strand:+ start:2470 stop:3420 length:951 start_codon:yes stop_codon:yes gene_type:complete